MGPGEVALRRGWWWQPQTPASHLLGVEPILAIGLQQVLVDDLIPQCPRQLDFLPRAMQVDDVKGDGPPDIVVAAKGRVGTQVCIGTCHRGIISKMMDEGVSARTGLVQPSEGNVTILAVLPQGDATSSSQSSALQ